MGSLDKLVLALAIVIATTMIGVFISLVWLDAQEAGKLAECVETGASAELCCYLLREFGQ